MNREYIEYIYELLEIADKQLEADIPLLNRLMFGGGNQ